MAANNETNEKLPYEALNNYTAIQYDPFKDQIMAIWHLLICLVAIIGLGRQQTFDAPGGFRRFWKVVQGIWGSFLGGVEGG